MTCSRELVEACLDRELDAAQQAALEQHLATCAECSALLARLRDQQTRVRAAAPYYGAPPALRRSVRDAVRNAAAETPGRQVRSLPWRGLAIAASLLLAVSLSWNVLRTGARPAESDLAKDAIADHIRSLLVDRTVEVVSSDQHTVKPWFAGRLDFAPDVRDLAAQGFPLAGGRVDYLAGRRVAALVYRRRLHVITLFTWPASSSSAAATSASRDGYHALSWTSGSMAFWAVSDVSPAELETFRALFR